MHTRQLGWNTNTDHPDGISEEIARGHKATDLIELEGDEVAGVTSRSRDDRVEEDSGH